MMEDEVYVGKLYRIKKHNVWVRGTGFQFHEGDMILCVSLERPEDSAALWRRQMTILHNGTLNNMFFTDFKGLLRHDEMEELNK